MAPASRRWRTDGLKIRRNQSDSSPIDFPPPVPIECREPLDSIVYQGAPPVTKTGGDADLGRMQAKADRSFPCIETVDPDPDGANAGQKSTPWIGSILAHLAVVLLIMFLVAPADLRGLSTQVLTITISEEDPKESLPMVLADETDAQDSSVKAEVQRESQVVEVEPIDVQFDIGRPAAIAMGIQRDPGKGSAHSSGGARGSFFGIEATGQDFVYIVDRSGSMNGRRYRRAVDELKRSVGELREDQRFLVILFSSSGQTMFGGLNYNVKLLQATEENKRRLDDWLVRIRPGGGTNPDSSLRLAMHVQPSAVFMLSDGEFSKSQSKPGNLINGGGDAYSIVQSARGKTPIHAIAFEDPRSCRNMKRLAALTGGEYRFVNSWGNTQSQLLDRARQLTSSPITSSGLDQQRALAKQFGSSQVTHKAKQQFAQALFDQFESRYGSIANRDTNKSVKESPKLADTVALLESLVAIDPNRSAIAEQLDLAAGELSRALQKKENSDQVEPTCDRLIHMPRSVAATQALNRLSNHYETLPEDDPEKIFNRLRLVRASHPRSELVNICQKAGKRVEGELLSHFNACLEKNEVAAAIESLRQLQSSDVDRSIRQLAYQTLQEVTMEQLVKAREASQQGDDQKKDWINDQLEKGFDGDKQLGQFRRLLVKRERDARQLLSQAEQSRSHVRLFREQLETIVKQYPETVATRKAKTQLVGLPAREIEQDHEEAELTRMLDDTPRRQPRRQSRR